MMPRMMVPGKNRIFYGWIALAGAMLTAFVAGGAFVYSYGVFLPVMCAEFGWSRAVVSVGLSLGLLAFGLPSPLTGILVARFGPRVNMIWGNSLAVLALAGMYLVQEVWHVYLLYVFAGFGSGIGGYIACTALANNWFTRKRALAIGLFAAGAAMGGFVFPPLATVLISSLGWRMSWLALAGIVFIVAVLIADVVIIRNKPEDMGLLPDGEPVALPEEEETGAYPSDRIAEPEQWPIRQAIRVPATWLIAVIAAANYYALGTMVAHQVAHVQDLGYSPVAAALAMSLVSGVGIVGRLGCGVAALRLDIRHLTITGIIIQLVALGILITTRSLVLIYIYAALFGLSNGMLITAMPTIVGEYFGRASYARIMGVIFAFGVAVEATAPVIAGLVYDATTTYTMAFLIVAVFSLVGLICVFLVRKPKMLQSYIE